MIVCNAGTPNLPLELGFNAAFFFFLPLKSTFDEIDFWQLQNRLFSSSLFTHNTTTGPKLKYVQQNVLHSRITFIRGTLLVIDLLILRGCSF